MTTLVTGSPQNSKAKLIRLLYEMQYRRCRVWEHPNFGGVDPKYHIPNSKHNNGRAGDLNRFFGQREEDDFFDNLAPEIMRRGFGAIWNRRTVSPVDHVYHFHVETIAYKSENYPGRVKLKRGLWRPSPRLVLDGIGGPKTITALQKSMGTYQDGELDWGGSLGKALQAFLNTELNSRLVVDGKLGTRSNNALRTYLGASSHRDKGPSKSQWREIQRRLNARGNIANYVK